jgi:hypothetical protein
MEQPGHGCARPSHSVCANMSCVLVKFGCPGRRGREEGEGRPSTCHAAPQNARISLRTVCMHVCARSSWCRPALWAGGRGMIASEWWVVGDLRVAVGAGHGAPAAACAALGPNIACWVNTAWWVGVAAAVVAAGGMGGSTSGAARAGGGSLPPWEVGQRAAPAWHCGRRTEGEHTANRETQHMSAVVDDSVRCCCCGCCRSCLGAPVHHVGAAESCVVVHDESAYGTSRSPHATTPVCPHLLMALAHPLERHGARTEAVAPPEEVPIFAPAAKRPARRVTYCRPSEWAWPHHLTLSSW